MSKAAHHQAQKQQQPIVATPKQDTATAQFNDQRPEVSSQIKVKQMAREFTAREHLPLQLKANATGLPDQLKFGIEQLSGYSMDDVKVHYNSPQPAQLRAHAYAQGNQIHLGPGQEKHLPHEAWHVVQQKQGRVQPTTQLKADVSVNDDIGLEREADQMGSRAARIGFNGRQSTLQYKAVQSKTVQRVVLTKIVGEWHKEEDGEDDEAETEEGQYWIYDVEIGGRTPSPFSGTMGAHSTAWAAHLDAIRRHLVGTTLGQGIEWMAGMAEGDLSSPLLKLDGYLNSTQRSNLGTARYHLENHLVELTKYDDTNLVESNYEQALVWLRSTVNAYLTYVNFLPTSTVEGGDPKGHGEGTARGVLNTFEFGASIKHREDDSDGDGVHAYDALDDEHFEAKESEEEADGILVGVKGNLKKLLQNNWNDETEDEEIAAYRKEIRETLLNLFADDTPEAYTETHRNLKDPAVKQEVWALMLQNFLRTIRLAYPYAYDFAEMHDETVIKAVIGALNSDLNADEVYAYLTGTKKFTAISGKYNFHSDDEDQDAANKAKIEAELDGDHVLEESAVRHTGTGRSDIVHSGSYLGVTVMLNHSGLIGDVLINGRTKSPHSGTMGAHTTAWTVHVDAIIRLLKGKSLSQALRMLIVKSRMEMAHNKALKFAGLIAENHQIMLVGGYNALKAGIDYAVLCISSKSSDRMNVALEALVGDYLNFENLIPMSTISIGGMPDGRAEGIHRTFLNAYEEEGSKVFKKDESAEEQKAIILEHLMGMFDPSGLEAFPPDLGDREDIDIDEYVHGGYDASHNLHQHITNTEQSTDDAKSIAYENFLHTAKAAYPRAVAAVGLEQRLKKRANKLEDAHDLIYKRAQIIRNPEDAVSKIYKGYQVEIRGVYNGKANVLLLATNEGRRVNVDLASLIVEKK